MLGGNHTLGEFQASIGLEKIFLGTKNRPKAVLKKQFSRRFFGLISRLFSY